METTADNKLSKFYLAVVILLMLILPIGSVIIDSLSSKQPASPIDLIGKWFVFWAIGIRLFSAGIKQAANPSFTAESIFHLKEKESYVIVKELGYANICLGIIGIVSLFIPAWRLAAACSGGLFFAIAGVNHIIKKPDSINEKIAMISDIFIGLVIAAYVIANLSF